MNCLCDNRHCGYFQKLRGKSVGISKSQKIIFTSHNSSLSVNDFVHIFVTGIRIVNIDLSFGCNGDLLRMMSNFDEAIKKFEHKLKFNEPITKICTLRGRKSRFGRMRNDKCWRLKGGNLIVLTCDERYRNSSTNEVCFVINFKRIIPLLKICDVIEIKGKNMQVQVVKVIDDYITCFIEKSGTIESHEKLSFMHLQELYCELIETEIEDCKFAVDNNFDFIIACPVLSSFATYATTSLSSFEAILARSIFAKKPIIVKFPKAQHLTRFSNCQNVDIYTVKCNEINDLIEILKQFKKISEDSAFNKKQDNLVGLVEELDVCKTNYTHSNSLKVESQVKAMVCITHSGRAIRDLAGSNNYRYILALTKDKTLAKRLHLFRNVLPMVFIDCSKKSEAEQRDEIMLIALKFGKAMKIIGSEDVVIERFN